MTANRFFPFHALGFECNPFRAMTDEEWAEVVVLPDDVRLIIEAGFENLQVLGEAGYGKTSLLLYLEGQKRLAGRRVVYERIPDNGRTFNTTLEGIGCFLLDEAQRLGTGERKRLLQETKDVGLVVGSHEDLSELFRMFKRPIETIRLDQSGPGHLAAVLNQRLTYFSLEGYEPEPFSEEMIARLWRRFGRNIRATEHYLYEVFQEVVEKDIGVIESSILNLEP